MVSEIQTEDDEMMNQLLKQGFLPLNTPVEKLGEASSSLRSASVYWTVFDWHFAPSLCSLHLIMFFYFPVKWTVIVSKMAAQ